MDCIKMVVAMNPCKCGYYPDRNRCHCSEYDIRRYIGRISNPMWDRFDMCVKVDEVTYEDIAGAYGKTDIQSMDYASNNKENKTENVVYSSAYMKEQVERVRRIQQERFKTSKTDYNSQMTMCCLSIYLMLLYSIYLVL